jgi:hypothetical protein
MRVRARIEVQNEKHTTFRIFVNGSMSGLLTVLTREAEELRKRLEESDGGNRGPKRKAVGA